MSTSPHPQKLKHDAIGEAVLEIRFECQDLPEVVVGRLADHTPWRSFARSRNPISDIPATLRLSDPQLRFQPLIDLIETGGCRVIKVGTNVISFHNTRPYMGWTRFNAELTALVTMLFEKFDDVAVRRLGLRYLNALEADKHLINSVSDLNVGLFIKKEKITQSFNVNYRTALTPDFICLTRIATPDFVQGDLPPATNAYVDVDIFTSSDYRGTSIDDVTNWINDAHDHEKDAFFKLLPDHVIDALKDE